MSLTKLSAWTGLRKHYHYLQDVHMRDQFEQDPERFEKFSLSYKNILLDYSKNRIDEKALELLVKLARQVGLEEAREAMFSGVPINTTENRSVLHIALRNRSNRPIYVNERNVMPEVNHVLDKMKEFSDAVRSGQWVGHTGKRVLDVVNIGIGGSYLGPRLVCSALKKYQKAGLRCHFVSNVDGTALTTTLRGLDPATTLFIIASKSFTTHETMVNARSARKWVVDKLGNDAIAPHFVALSVHKEKVMDFGIHPKNMFVMWDWVGGRYSVWSSIGLSIAISIGFENFERFLNGAHLMDEHFRTAPLEDNMPVILGMLSVWYTNFFGAETEACLPYDNYLQYFPNYLKQLYMESNGKSVTKDGQKVSVATGTVLLGGAGTNAQHSFFQLIHQGTHLIPCDFIAPVFSHNELGDHHTILLANFLAQTEALMKGKTKKEVKQELEKEGLSSLEIDKLLPHKVFEGNRPSNILLVKKFDPETLGMLIALYEHKIFVQGVVWNINSFDQWGVQLGKELAQKILPQLKSPHPTEEHYSSTNSLIEIIKRLRGVVS